MSRGAFGAGKIGLVNHDQIGDFVELGGFAIDDNESRTAAFGHKWETGRRPYHQRGPNGEKQVTTPRQFLSTLHCLWRHGLTE